MQLVMVMTIQNTSTHHQNLNVLIADDEAPLVLSITFALKGMNHNVISARTGSEAFIKIKEAIENKHPFDLMILDLKMPKFSGLELINLLNKLHIKLPIIVMSNYDSRDQIEKLGIQHFLPKPFSKEELTAKISEFQKKVTLKPDSGV